MTRTGPSVLLAMWVLWWSMWTLIFVAVIVSEAVSTDPTRVNGILAGTILGIMSATLGGAGLVAARIRRRADPRLPGRKSAAREPMARLAEAERALPDLLAQLRSASVPQNVLDTARHTANETAAHLRVIAAKVGVVESAIAHASAARRAGLEDGVRSLLTHLERGLDGYRELIAAAGHVVLAGAHNHGELVEATAQLAGHLVTLRELSRGP